MGGIYLIRFFRLSNNKNSIKSNWNKEGVYLTNWFMASSLQGDRGMHFTSNKHIFFRQSFIFYFRWWLFTFLCRWSCRGFFFISFSFSFTDCEYLFKLTWLYYLDLYLSIIPFYKLAYCLRYYFCISYDFSCFYINRLVT